jgi:hypothetical protein
VLFRSGGGRGYGRGGVDLSSAANQLRVRAEGVFDGAKAVTEEEIRLARALGQRVASTAQKLQRAS